MLLALLLGLVGSLGHCVGMCSGVTLLFTRRGIATTRAQFALLHLGRVTTYAILGLTAGAIGEVAHHATTNAQPGFAMWQGAIAIIAALIAFYFAITLIGRAPSPEIMLVRFTRGWGALIQRLPTRAPILFGLAWGFLPCGLVLTALVMAGAAGSPAMGAITMIAFGIGTFPALFGIALIAQKQLAHSVPRHIAAFVVFLFGAQMALRGLAAFGIVDHMHLGGIALW